MRKTIFSFFLRGGARKILKFSTLKDEFFDDYHLLKLKIRNGENHSLHDPLRGKLAVGEKI